MIRVALLVFIALAGFTTSALARDYQVEVLVFERSQVSSETQEQWDSRSNRVAKNQTRLQVIAGKTDDLPLQSGVSRLKRIEGELLASGYRVLQSLRWQQPARVFPQAPVVNISNPGNPMQGYLRIYKTSLIFADVMIGLAGPGSLTAQPLYFIDEKRRLKFKEVHYFDHPKMGVILGVWPA